MTATRERLFSASEYWKMAELGFFNRERVELIGGRIVGMSPQSNWHALGIARIREALEQAFGPAFWVRTQNSLDLTPHSVPDPDVAVVPGAPAQYLGQRQNPKSALLIVEVSETTLADDRTEKASLYAASGILDYWILNLVDAVLEIRRDPQPDSSQTFGFRYASLQTLQRSDFACPLAAPTSSISVDALLPY
jgi:Uma2 family endonuclease